MNRRELHVAARLIFAAQWGPSGFKYSTNRRSDWRSKDARRAVEYLATKYDLVRKTKNP